MTVKEFIKLLEQEDPEAIVIMAKDSEGNCHSPMSYYWTGGYEPYTEAQGRVGFMELNEELITDGYTEEDVIVGEKAIILCPVL